MPCIEYEKKKFHAVTLAIIDHANSIIDEMMSDGFKLTVRQLYYQFVAQDLIPNTMRSYNRIKGIVSDARLAGLIDWEAIEDRTRKLEELPHFDNPADIMRQAVKQFRIDKWADQDYRPQVWIEKQALAGIIEGICHELDVPYFCTRGYNSQSAMWESGRKFLEQYDNMQSPVVIHLADHDPSGVQMTDDIERRLELFGESASILVRREALRIHQITRLKLPPNPAKITDSRYEAYRTQFGDDSWELDALPPKLLVEIIRAAVLGYRDEKAWKASLKVEKEWRAELAELSKKVSGGKGYRDE